MATPRASSALEIAAPSGGFGFMEPAFHDAGSTFSAIDVGPCPGCQAASGALCAGPKICQDRMTAARDLINSGKLKPRGEAASHAVPEEMRVPGLPERNWSSIAQSPNPQGPKPKLSPVQQAEVRRRYRLGVKMVDLAREFDVSQPTISKIIRQS